MHVYKSINAVQAELARAGIAKADTNTFDNYKFRGIDSVYNALAPLLAKHGLLVLPRMLGRVCEERQSAKGGALFYVTVEAEFDFVSAEDGSRHTVKTFGEAMDRGDKATNKAMSAAYKYACFQAFCIPTEGDNDADGTTHEVKAKTRDYDIPNQRERELKTAADAAIEKFAAGNEWGAYEEVCGITDNEEKLWLWNYLGRSQSALRAAIKRLAEEERKKEVKA